MLWFSRSLCQELPNGRRAGKQESVNYPKEAKEPVGQESPRAHIEVLKGRQSLYNPFGILKWARGDSRPTGFLASFGYLMLYCFPKPRLFESSWGIGNLTICPVMPMGNAQRQREEPD